MTETRLPRNLAKSLEDTTTNRTKISEVAKRHENTIRVLQDEASQELEQARHPPPPPHPPASAQAAADQA